MGWLAIFNFWLGLCHFFISFLLCKNFEEEEGHIAYGKWIWSMRCFLIHSRFLLFVVCSQFPMTVSFNFLFLWITVNGHGRQITEL